MTPSSDRESPRHSIGVAARRTGLKPDLIRAWERRYGAVTPARSETRRRRYSDTEIRRLRLLRQAVGGGRNIGDIAHLPDEDLEELIAGDTAATLAAESSMNGAVRALGRELEDQDEAAEAILDACLLAAKQLDPSALAVELERASVALSRIHLLDRLLVPLMHRIGNLWQDGALRPVHEHMASAIVRSFLGGLRTDRSLSDGAPRMVLTTPPRQRHELGALMAAATAVAEGWQALYLGPDLPAEEIAAGALDGGAQAVGLSIVYPPDDPALPAELAKLCRLLGDGVTLLVGGRCAAGYFAAHGQMEGRLVQSLPELREVLTELRIPA